MKRNIEQECNGSIRAHGPQGEESRKLLGVSKKLLEGLYIVLLHLCGPEQTLLLAEGSGLTGEVAEEGAEEVELGVGGCCHTGRMSRDHISLLTGITIQEKKS